MRFIVFLIFCLLTAFSSITYAQPNTEIYVFDLISKDGSYVLSNPVNVSNQNPGYDNQPHFTTDGRLLYTSTVKGQTEALLYDFNTQKRMNLSQSAANEFSPTPTPDGNAFSCIYDTTQNLVRYAFNNPKDTTVLINNAVVGYHAWLNADELILFVLGSPNSLQRYQLSSNKSTLIDTLIGRSLHKIPGMEAYSYINKKSMPFMVVKRNIDSNEAESLIALPDNTEDIAWTPEGELISSSNSKVLITKAPFERWEKLADLSDFGLSGITRLNVSISGDKIAIVVDE